jgi:hypothetical protein
MRRGKTRTLGAISMARTFTATDGLSVPDLLHFGFDHVASAGALLKKNARHFDSAGYLAHMGIECLLKSWHLHVFGEYQGTHRLDSLWNKLRECLHVRQLSKRELGTLQAIDTYAELRYPTLNCPVEIGDEDWPKISALEGALLRRMPKDLRDVIGRLHWSRKGGRVLMQKPIGRKGRRTNANPA